MSDQRSRMRGFVAGAVAGADDVPEPAVNLAHALFHEELGREPDPGGVATVEDAVRSGLSGAEVRRRIRSSIERLETSDDLIGAASASYRDLAAVGAIRRAGVAPLLVAECIAAYRLVLGRDPDSEGFLTYVDHRATRQLVVVIDEMAASAEARSVAGPFPLVPPEQIALHVASTATQLLGAVVADAAHAKVHRALDRLETVLRRLDTLETRIERLTATAEMRLDAAAAP